MVTDIIEASWASSGEVDLQKPAILMSPIMIEAANELKNFLFEFVYNIQCMQQQTEMARLTIKKLYDYLCNHTELLPLDYQLTAEGDPARAVVDYIAGMTDHFATDLARQLSL
jgi:dGTPase